MRPTLVQLVDRVRDLLRQSVPFQVPKVDLPFVVDLLADLEIRIAVELKERLAEAEAQGQSPAEAVRAFLAGLSV